jgi:hypothetical protein
MSSLNADCGVRHQEDCHGFIDLSSGSICFDESRGDRELNQATPICRYMMSASFAFAPLHLRRDLMDQPKQGAQQNAQQRPSVGLRSRFGCAAVSVISLYSRGARVV